MTNIINAKLKLIKLSVLLVLTIYIFSTIEFGSTNIIDGYTNKPSYFPNETCKLYINDVVNNHKRIIKISDVSKTFSKQFTLMGINQDTADNAWRNGFGYKESGSISLQNFKSNLYQIENGIPFVVKPNINTYTDLLIIVPYLNYHAASNAGGKSFYSHNSLHNESAVMLSLNRPLIVTDKDIAIADFANKYLQEYNFGFITDFDLLMYKNISKTKMLLFYGDMSFVSPQMRKNIDLFIASGGNVLFVNNTLMMNIIRVDIKNKRIIFQKNNQKIPKQWNNSTLQNLNCETVGASYDLGFVPDSVPEFILKNINDSSLLITEKKHTIFNSIATNKKTITINCELWNSPPLLGINDSGTPIIDEKKLNMLYYKILAYKWSVYNGYKYKIGAIVEFKKNIDSGICINMGSGCWIDYLSEDNENEQLLFNTIKYLQDNSLLSKRK